MKIHFVLLLCTILTFSACKKEYSYASPVNKTLTQTVFASGVLDTDKFYNVSSQTSGTLSRWSVEKGDDVSQGQFLALIDNKDYQISNQSNTGLYNQAAQNLSPNAPALLQAQHSAEIAQSNLDLHAKNKARYFKLLQSGSIAKIEYEKAELEFIKAQNQYKIEQERYNQLVKDAQTQLIKSNEAKQLSANALGNNSIYALENGTVIEKYKELGDYIRTGEVLAKIGNTDRIYAKITVDETNISKVKIGQRVWIQLNTNLEKNYKGEITEILPSFDQTTQGYLCKVRFIDPLDFKILSTPLQANIEVSAPKSALMIPKEFLLENDFVKIKGQKELVKVTVKNTNDNWIEISGSGINTNTKLEIEKTETPKP
ncbi:MAG: hypothetical protein C4K58_03440 [Flavobacteriaceae bacterium]|nr:MAG: hypothetical protein C4K58_03440 [Flavobacteriaceae bacterium]